MLPHVFADHRPPRVLLAQLGDLGGAIGAALLAQRGGDGARLSAHGGLAPRSAALCARLPAWYSASASGESTSPSVGCDGTSGSASATPKRLASTAAERLDLHLAEAGQRLEVRLRAPRASPRRSRPARRRRRSARRRGRRARCTRLAIEPGKRWIAGPLAEDRLEVGARATRAGSSVPSRSRSTSGPANAFCTVTCWSSAKPTSSASGSSTSSALASSESVKCRRSVMQAASGIVARTRVPPPAGLSTLEAAAEHLDAVGEAEQARCRSRCRRRRRRRRRPRPRSARRRAARSAPRPGSPARSARRWRATPPRRSRRRARSRQRQLALVDVDLDRHVGGRAQRLQRLPEPALATARPGAARARACAAPRAPARAPPRRAATSQRAGSSSSSFMRDDPQQVRDREQPLLRAVVEVAPDAAALGVGRLDHPRARLLERARLVAPLELRGRARGEDPQRRGVLLARPPSGACRAPRGGRGGRRRRSAGRPRGSSARPSLTAERVVREALGQRLRERHPRVVGDHRARRAGGVVLERLLHEGAVVPADERAHVHAGGVVRLGDQDHLGRERLGDVAGRGSAGTRPRPRPRCPRRPRASSS